MRRVRRRAIVGGVVAGAVAGGAVTGSRKSAEEKTESFCTNCGEKLQAEVKFCPKCGTPKK
jgi:hypothetical protein